MMESTDSKISTQIKLERIKRSWTQEYLAELSGLSVRTIQRAENGAVPAPETLRILAEKLEFEASEYVPLPHPREHFEAPWSNRVKWTTGICSGLLFGVTFFIPGWAGMLSIGLLILSLFVSVRGYSIQEGKLLIHRLGWSTRFRLQALNEVSVNPQATMGSIRVFGMGGLFCYLGYFRNGILGNYSAYFTDPAQAMILKFGKKTIVISPDDPAEMKRAIEQFLRNTNPTEQ